jgi:hypothetical protein
MFMDHANPVLLMKNKTNAIKKHIKAEAKRMSEIGFSARQAR